MRRRNTGTCVDVMAHPPSAMVDGRADTWWQSSSRRKTVRLLGASVDFDAEIFLDLLQARRTRFPSFLQFLRWVAWHSGRTSVSDWRTFPVPR